MLEYPLRRSPIMQDTMQIAATPPPTSSVASLLPANGGNQASSPDSPNGNNNAAAAAMAAAAAGATGPGGLPQALHNLQRLLQSQLANVSPLHLQQALQRQQQQQMADAGRKQLEQMLQQMQEQLQMNLLQQTHLSSSGPSKAAASTLHGLQQQQQQLVAQMQMTQQALMLGSGAAAQASIADSPATITVKNSAAASPRGGLMGAPRERHISETYGSTGSEGSLKENSKPDNNNHGELLLSAFKADQIFNGQRQPQAPPSSGNNGLLTADVKTKVLLSAGHCQWPGCDASAFNDAVSFQRHLLSAHAHDDRATAQTRVQMQIVTQLELQLNKEREKLSAMMDHLQLEARNGELVTMQQKRNSISRRQSRSPSPKRFKAEPRPRTPEHMHSQNAFHNALASLGSLPTPTSIAASMQQSPLSALTAAVRSPLLLSSGGIPVSSSPSMGALRAKPASALTDKPSPSMPLPPGFDERRGRGDRGNPNLDPAMDIKMNREFYMHNDVRPPYTYAALIRYAIHESPDQQLTLHEIYNWFTTTFQYFRRNAASWKNAVRHNLSLHKCFMRVENVKGAVWTVDDEEYHRRRPPRGVQSSGGPGGASASNSPTMTPQAPSLLDQSLSSMLAAAASAQGAAGGSFHDRLPFFNHAALMEQARRSSSAAFPDLKSSGSGMDSPPASLDNRSTPGSLDLSRVRGDLKAEDLEEEEEEEDMMEGPPTMVPPTMSALSAMQPQEHNGSKSAESSPAPKMEEEEDNESDEKKTSLMSSSPSARSVDAQDLSAASVAKCDMEEPKSPLKEVVEMEMPPAPQETTHIQ